MSIGYQATMGSASESAAHAAEFAAYAEGVHAAAAKAEREARQWVEIVDAYAASVGGAGYCVELAAALQSSKSWAARNRKPPVAGEAYCYAQGLNARGFSCAGWLPGRLSGLTVEQWERAIGEAAELRLLIEAGHLSTEAADAALVGERWGRSAVFSARDRAARAAEDAREQAAALKAEEKRAAEEAEFRASSNPFAALAALKGKK